MLWSWVTQGILKDPFNEFFIEENVNVEKDKLWEEKYSIRRSMRPAFISMRMARNILKIGKSLNFMRESCDDSDWFTTLLELKQDLLFTDMDKLCAIIEDISCRT